MHPLAATLILLTGVTSLAQAPSAVRSESRASSVVLREIPVGTGCPIGFRADRQSTAQILTAGSAKQNEPALGLHLTLDRQTTPAIESVEFTVYGLSPRSRILPADLLTSDADTTDIISKSFELQKGSNNETLSNADVWMSKAGALRWVDLNEIRYTNGTTWHPSASTKCRAIPSNFVLVGRR
jgi:hypothetical protein